LTELTEEPVSLAVPVKVRLPERYAVVTGFTERFGAIASPIYECVIDVVVFPASSIERMTSV
jgi:hypothetical protein